MISQEKGVVMKLCGRDGEELRCCKTGLIIHDTAFHPDSRHAADLFFCPTCHMLYIERNNNDYFTAHPAPPHCTITNDVGQPILWDTHFACEILDNYGVDIYVYNTGRSTD